MKSGFRIALMVIALGTVGSMAGAESSPAGRVVDRFYQAYRQGSVDGMMQMYAADAVFEDVNQRHKLEGSEQLEGFLSRIVSLHSRMGLREKRRVGLGSIVVVEYEYTGIISGEALRQVSGKDTCQDVEYVLPVTSWYEIKEDRIIHQKDFIDLTTYREIQQQALGTTPPGGNDS